MRHENGFTANRQRLAALFALLAVVLVIVGLLAAVVVGLGGAIGWVVTYLIPTLVILGVVIAALALLVGVVKRLPESSLRDWYQ